VSDIEKSTLIQVFEAARVFPDPEEIEHAVEKLRRRQPKTDPIELSRRVIRGTTARLTGAGAVAALPGAVPGLGMWMQITINGATLSAEAWMLLRNLTSMQLTVAGLHGHDVRSPDRRDELVIVWGLETGAILPAAEVAEKVGTRIAIKQFNNQVSGQVFKKINQKLGTTVVTKWGTKRGGVALGRLIPFGVGVAVGGSVNYLTARSFGAAAIRYYSQLLPGDQDVVVVV